jgi:arylsulfatase A-like enzyme
MPAQDTHLILPPDHARRLLPLLRSTIVLATLVSLLGCRGAEHPNVVLVVIDTLRRDGLSGFGNERPTSPCLDRLMSEGVVFENLVSTSSHTAPAIASLLTGLYPSQNSVHFHGKKNSFDGEHHSSKVGPHFDASLTSLAERLRDAGYRTGAVVSNPWLRPEFGFDQGFETYVSLRCGNLCSGSDVARAGLSWLSRESGTPFFLYLHFMDVHNPYRKPGITREVFVQERGIDLYRNGRVPALLRPNDLEYMRALYDEGILRADGHLSHFLDELTSYSPAERTLLVVLSDHGEEFSEHGGIGHGTTLYEELVGSFLLLHYPKRLVPARIAAAVSMVDVAPTILDLTRIGGFDRGSGQSLLPWLAGSGSGADARILFSELGSLKSARKGHHKLVLDLDTGARELYELREDPGEKNDVSVEHEEIANELATGLLRFVANAREPIPGSPGGRPVDEELREQLRSLGYVE